MSHAIPIFELIARLPGVLVTGPADRIVTLQDQVPESELMKLPMLDATGDLCLVVFKSSAKTGMTIGRANNVPSYTRKHFAG